MKRLTRSYLITVTALFLATKIVDSFSYAEGNQTLLLGAFVLMLINMVVKPIVKIFFLPINMITLGLFSLVINALMLYLLTIILPQFRVQPYTFNGFSSSGFVIPSIHFSILATFIFISTVISAITAFLHWIAK